MTKYTYTFRREDMTIVSGEIPAYSYEEAFETAKKLAQAVRPNIDEDDIQVYNTAERKAQDFKNTAVGAAGCLGIAGISLLLEIIPAALGIALAIWLIRSCS